MRKHVALAIAAAGFVGLWVAGCSDPEGQLKSPDPREVVKGLNELKKRQDEEAVRVIADTVSHPNELVATEAVRALAETRRPAAQKILRNVATTDKRDGVRQEAVGALGKNGGPEAMGVLRQVIRADPDPRVRSAAALGMVRQRSLEDVPLLVEVAETEQDPVVQTRAVRAIEVLLGMTFRYDPGAPLAERKKAIERIRMQAATVAADIQAGQRAKAQRKGP